MSTFLRIPETPLGIALEFGIAFVAAVFVLSTLEHLIHKHLMHRRRFPKSWYKKVPYLQLIFFDHAVRHHHRYYKDFDYEADPVGKLHGLYIENRETIIMASIAMLFLAPVFLFASPLGVTAFLIVGIAHNKLWNAVHDQMHIPEHNHWFRDTALYRWLARHHFMHHVDTRNNLNVVFPLVDFIVGAVAKPELKDIREMYRLGYLVPRTKGGARGVAFLQEKRLEKRERDLEKDLQVEDPPELMESEQMLVA